MGIFRIARQAFSFIGRGTKYGKLIGKSKNGIKVYKKTGNNGENIITSLKNGSVRKEIIKTNTNKSGFYNNVTAHTTTVKDHVNNKSIVFENENTYFRQDTSWLDRVFKRGQTVNRRAKTLYNDLNPSYKSFADLKTNYSIHNDTSWSYSVHHRPNITKVTIKNKIDENLQSLKNYFELNNFKFPGGAVHNGRIGYEKGISPLDGEYLRKINVNPYGDYLDIKYNV